MNVKLLQGFVAALATEFVGRKELRQTLHQRILEAPPGPQVLAMIGNGGMGKTRLERDILEWGRTQPGLLAAKDLVDLYHYVYHTPTGLADQLVKELEGCDNCFDHYHALRSEMDLQRLGGFSNAEKSEEALKAFISAIRKCSENRRLVIVQDTAERLKYFQQRAVCWEWLVKSLPDWGNVTLVMAGRTECRPLMNEVGAEIFPVGAFNEQDSLDYFDAAVRSARSVGAQDVARNIEALTPAMRRKAHEQAQGQPIRLAMLVALLSMGALPSTDAEEDILISQLIETPDLGETIVALGRLPRGATRQLLGEVLELPSQEAEMRFEAVKGLAFVKPRIEEDEETLFLHDEMYAMLDRQVYSQMDDRARAKKINQLAVDYYRRKLLAGVDQVNLAYKPIEEAEYNPQEPPKPQGEEQLRKLADLLGWQQALIADRVFYRFRWDWAGGFRYYYTYLQIAISAGDFPLYLQLQAEANAALAISPSESELELLEGALQMSPVIETWIRGNYSRVLEEAKKLRETYPARFVSGDQTGWADGLNVYEAFARIYRARKDEQDWEFANDILTKVIDHLSGEPMPECDWKELAADHWHRLAVLAMAYQERGYLKSQQGHLRQAEEDYFEAVQMWRDLKIEATHARALNDRGYVLSLLGQHTDVKALVIDALAMRKRIGRRGPVALSLNTLGIINRFLGDYAGALTMSWRALHLATFLGATRAKGLALTALAEAIRRQVTADSSATLSVRLRDLEQAEKWAAEAQEIFKHRGEKSREVRAWIEIGCARRDQVRYLMAEIVTPDQTAAHQSKIKALTDAGITALRTAFDLAQGLSLYDQIDALVDLAWLAHYSNNDELLQSVWHQALKIIPAEYQWFDPDRKAATIRQDEAPEASLWQQLGKLYMLLGFRALRTFEITRDLAVLSQAAHNHAIGLQYSNLYSENFPPLLHARQQMYDAYKPFNRHELEAVAAGVLRFESEFKTELHREPSAMHRFLQNFALWRTPQPPKS